MAAWSPDNKVWVVIGQAGSVSRRFDARVLRQVILIPLSYALILMAALWLATSRGLKPLALLGQRIAARQAGSQQLIADAAHDPVELQPITAALDAYALRETQLRAAEKRFFADAAHEMRTPLAVIAAQAHVLSQEPHPDRRAKLLDGLQSGVQRAAAVLAKVLTLSRLDADDWQADTASTSRVDLGNVLRERVAEHAVRAMDSGHDLGLSEGPPLSVTVDASLLGIAIDNLIDNALNYCPKGSRIDVSWGLQDGVPWCAVEDDGPGIAADERERVFRRFERGAAAHDRVGSGLGLAIASEVALKHGGSLRLEAPALGRGCRFVMRFLMAQ
jgi:two-component system OmpR family sensor kinase